MAQDFVASARWLKARPESSGKLGAIGFCFGGGIVNQLAVRVPEGLDGKAVQGRMLREHGIEIGGGLGPDAPAMWRIGLMGRNASVETADRVLGALDAVLADSPVAAVA